MMKLMLIAVASVVALAAGVAAQTRVAAKPLEIYVVDVEGGKADLWVTPSGTSIASWK